MKIYEWKLKDMTGKVIANSMKEAKIALLGVLRGADKSFKRIPNGTKVKKIGLTKEQPKVVATSEAPASDAATAGAKAGVAVIKRAHEAAPVAITSMDFWELKKEKAFSGGTLYFPNGDRAWVADDAEHIVKKGVKCAFIPDVK